MKHSDNPNWNHQPLALGFSTCPEAQRGYCYSYEWSRESCDIIKRIEDTRQGKRETSPLWRPNPVADHWPETPFLGIPEEIRAKQITVWIEQTYPDWLKTYRSYLDNAPRQKIEIELNLPEPLEASTSIHAKDLFKILKTHLSGGKRTSNKRAVSLQYRDQLRMLAVLRWCQNNSLEAVWSLLLNDRPEKDGPEKNKKELTQYYNSFRAFKDAYNRAHDIRASFTVKALIRAIEGGWFPPFSAQLMPPIGGKR